MPKRSSKPQKPKDVNQLAARIVETATRDTPPKPSAEKNPAAVVLGRLGGLRGGKARAEQLTSAQRSDIARHAAKVRWKATRTKPKP